MLHLPFRRALFLPFCDDALFLSFHYFSDHLLCTCISSWLLTSRYQDGIRHVRDLLGEGTGEGGERLQATCRSDICECERERGWPRAVKFWMDMQFQKRCIQANEEPSDSTTYWRIPTSCQIGPAWEPLPCSGIAWEWPQCENGPERPQGEERH